MYSISRIRLDIFVCFYFCSTIVFPENLIIYICSVYGWIHPSAHPLYYNNLQDGSNWVERLAFTLLISKKMSLTQI